MDILRQDGQAEAVIRWGNLRSMFRQGPTGQIANQFSKADIAMPDLNHCGIEDVVVNGESRAHLMLGIRHHSRVVALLSLRASELPEGPSKFV